MQRIHLALGFIGFILFLLTGLYMHYAYDHLYGMSNDLRMIFRANHIYILYISIIHLALGCYWQNRQGWRRFAQTTGSLLFIVAFIITFKAFVDEPHLSTATELIRPYSGIAIQLLPGAIFLHLMAAIKTNNHDPGKRQAM